MGAYGMKGHVSIMFQESFGTAKVDSFTSIAITEESLTLNIEQVGEQGMKSRFAEGDLHPGLSTIEGDISMEVNPVSIGAFLRSAVGCSSVTSDTATQTHVFKPLNSDPFEEAATDLITAEVYLDQGSAFLFSDLAGDSLTFNISNGELLNATLSGMGAGFAKQVAGTPVFPTAKPFLWSQFSGTFNGVAINDITDMTIAINNNLESKHTLSTSNAPTKIKRTGFRTIELTGTMLFQQQSYFDAFQAGTEMPMIFNFKTAEAPNELTFDFPKVRFTNHPITITGPGIIEMSFTAKALFHAGSNTSAEITLVNTTAAYL